MAFRVSGARASVQREHVSESRVRIPRCTAADAMIDALVMSGVDTFFGIPGGPIMPVFDSVVRSPEARLIEPRHETYGAFEAMGFHRASGRVPAVVVTAGPGATNVVTGVTAAHCERVPMIVIVGDVASQSSGKRLLQDTGLDGIGIESMLRGVTRGIFRVQSAASSAGVAINAFVRATDPSNPGPVVIVIPIEHSSAKLAMPAQHVAPRTVLPSTSAPPHDLLSALASRLATAQRPLVVVGAGCRDGRWAVQQLIEQMRVPFVTTPQAKGLIPETHPLSLRTCGMSASFWARRYCAEGPDFTLALATDLDDVSTAGTPVVGPDGTLVHVTLDGSVVGRNFETTHGVACDVLSFASAFGELVATRGGSPIGAAHAERIRAESPFDLPEFARDAPSPIAPHRVIADLQAAADADTTFVTDIGEHMLFALHYLTIEEGQRFVIHLGLGSMASGIASSIGQALADPSRRVICVCGDGGMQMAGTEILVAVKHRLPVVFAVFNDARYNMVFHGYRMTFGREEAWDAPPVDFVGWARSLGARGACIRTPGEITRELLDELTAGGSPCVLDIRHDASIRIRGDGRIEALRQMSMTAQHGEGST
ncbi:MAG TPA: thiamine pyrophosphate-binding protein [Polyangiaceae bacterium]|nr:thiamine pyrophosphate-binding protein [Polyangiaceae bacterium]